MYRFEWLELLTTIIKITQLFTFLIYTPIPSLLNPLLHLLPSFLPSSPSLSSSFFLYTFPHFISFPPHAQELIPIEVEVSIPYEFHRYIIGQQGKEVRSLMKECSVNITVPPSDQQSDIIVVSGMF